MNCASELDTGMDHDAELEHVHGPGPACMIEHRHTPPPAQQGAQIGTAGGRVDYALAPPGVGSATPMVAPTSH